MILWKFWKLQSWRFWCGFNDHHNPQSCDTNGTPPSIVHLLLTTWVDAFQWSAEMNNNTSIMIYVFIRNKHLCPHKQKPKPTKWVVFNHKRFFEHYIIHFNEKWRQCHNTTILIWHKHLFFKLRKKIFNLKIMLWKNDL